MKMKRFFMVGMATVVSMTAWQGLKQSQLPIPDMAYTWLEDEFATLSRSHQEQLLPLLDKVGADDTVTFKERSEILQAIENLRQRQEQPSYATVAKMK